jgi:hypothetical protein
MTFSGHGRGDERRSAAERRINHRDDPEGSGVMARGLRLVSGSSDLPERDALLKKLTAASRAR